MESSENLRLRARQYRAMAQTSASTLRDAPQPMNFYMLEQLQDGESVFLDDISSFSF